MHSVLTRLRLPLGRMTALLSCALIFSACAKGVHLDVEGPVDELIDGWDVPPPNADEPITGRGLPCAVERILDTQCGHCHGESPTFGAPMSLFSWTDLHARYTDPSEMGLRHGAGSTDYIGRHVFELVAESVRHTRRPMPPQPAPRLSPVEIDTLVGWAEMDAPPGIGCNPVETDDPGDPSDLDDEDPADLGNESPSPSPSPSPAPAPTPSPMPPSETGDARCDYEFELRAHDGNTADDPRGYPVPLSRDHYECFYFRLPYAGEVHGLSFEPIVDNARVLHHWLLYEESNTRVSDGDHTGCIGVHEGAELVAGWAPGGNPLVMPEGVGMKLPAGDDRVFVLEVHYNNSARTPDLRDRSGVRICATSDLRPETAGMQWLGTEQIFMLGPGTQDFSGECNPRLSSPVTIIKSSPHMHRRGRHLKTVIHRQGGQQETLIDEPFDFEHQVIYDTPAVVHPGDSLRTTCTFEHDGGLAGFGSGTGDEMCYNFVVAYPHGALSTGGSLTGSENACLR